MDVYQASANMIAFSEFVVAAAKSTYGDQTDARAEVAGFGRGSFVTDIVFSMAGPAATVFSLLTAKDFQEVIKQAFELWKHLKGQPPKGIAHDATSQTMKVTNNNGQILQVRAETVHLVFNDKASDSVRHFVHDALGREGVDRIEIATEAEPIAAADQDDAGYFVAVRPSETVADTTIRMALVIEAPVFKDDLKWRFWDGSNSFFAAIIDKEFLARVDAGERFGKGDMLTVDLRIVQERSGLKISVERSVMKVIEHRFGQEQSKLF
ncbi:MAG: hypothetical protein EPO23_13100 [Xanthobacteraceae bacterium]|nr:MAG: hypothetical protein EPO23_13100 [Xanthobacteraceae bacterium]